MDEKLKKLLTRLAYDQDPCHTCGDPGCELAILVTYNFGDKRHLNEGQRTYAEKAMAKLDKKQGGST